MRSQGELMFKDVYSKYSNLSNIKTKNMNSSNVVRADTFDDNIDVPTTGGDDTFQNVKTQEDPSLYNTYANVDEIPMASPPKKQQKTL